MNLRGGERPTYLLRRTGPALGSRPVVQEEEGGSDRSTGNVEIGNSANKSRRATILCRSTKDLLRTLAKRIRSWERKSPSNNSFISFIAKLSRCLLGHGRPQFWLFLPSLYRPAKKGVAGSSSSVGSSTTTTWPWPFLAWSDVVPVFFWAGRAGVVVVVRICCCCCWLMQRRPLFPDSFSSSIVPSEVARGNSASWRRDVAWPLYGSLQTRSTSGMMHRTVPGLTGH